MERTKIIKVLFGTRSDKKKLFPLYQQISNSSDTNSLQNLRTVMRGFTENTITDKSQAIAFIDAIHKFNTDYSKKISKSISASQTSTDKSNAVITQGVSNPEKTPPPPIPLTRPFGKQTPI